MNKSPITTHVLDTAAGRPARGVPVTLEARQADGGWRRLASGTTDGDGRIPDLLPAGAGLEKGVYRLTFLTGVYFKEHGVQGFYPEAPVVFELREPGGHYHVPLLLSPYGYATYRGS